LAVAVGGGTSSVARDEPTLLFADGVGLSAAARGGDTLGAAIGGQTLLVADPSFDGDGGASESGGDSDV
jgi:class 3 adenylate cyclase